MATTALAERIEGKIFFLRGHRVMLDRDLAQLYGVSTKALNQAVKRNKSRFPKDFMFRPESSDATTRLSSRSRIVTLKRGQNIKYRPYVFTEHGAVMLANVLKSTTAIRARIHVVRAFVHLRRSLARYANIARKLELLERKVGKQGSKLRAILDILCEFLEPALPPPKREMGFSAGKQKG